MGVLLLFGSSGTAQPIADFKASPASGCSPLVVKFINTSSSAQSFEWDFGNGNRSTLKDPSAIYYIPGKYTVTLTAIDASGRKDTKIIRNIRVFKDPKASFASGARSICEGSPAQFRSTSLEGDTSIQIFSWDFGDGSLGSGAKPVHEYTRSGTYKVSLFIQDLNGCRSDTIISDFVTVLKKPTAAFSMNQRTFCSAPASVVFKNSSSNAASYSWDFGDGQNSSTTDPVHTYTTFGSFDPVLVATASNGCTDTARGADPVSISPLKAAFRLKEAPCGPANFTFTSEASGYSGLTYRWDFGNGKTSSAQEPSQYLVPGTYKVKLTVYNTSCYANVEQEITIKPKPTGSISYTPKPICGLPATVNLQFTGNASAKYQWKMDGESVGSSMSITRKLEEGGSPAVEVLVDLDGCSQVFRDTLSISNPKLEILPDTGGCLPLPVQFKTNLTSNQPAVKFEWDFGDKGKSNLRNPKHTYTDTGAFTATLTITDALGCTASATTRILAGVKVEPKLSYDTSAVCNGETKYFTNRTNEDPLKPQSYTWIIAGDAREVVEGDLTHKIRKPPGYKEVLLISNYFGCTDTFKHPDRFFVKAPFADLLIEGDTCGPATITVSNQSIGETEFAWLGKPFDSYSGDSFSVVLDPGYYLAGIAAFNNKTGCRDTGWYEFNIFRKPDLTLETSGNIDCPPVELNVKINTAYARKLFIQTDGVPVDYSHLLPSLNLDLKGMPSKFDLTVEASNYDGCISVEKRSFNGDGPSSKGSISWKGKCLPYDLKLIDSTYGKDGYKHFWAIGNSAPVEVNAVEMDLQLFEKIPGVDSVPVRLIVGNDTCRDIRTFHVPVSGLDLKIGQVSDVQCNTIAYGLTVNASPSVTGLQYQWGLNGKWKSYFPDKTTTYIRQLDGTTDTVQVRVLKPDGCATMLTHFLNKPDPRLSAVFKADTSGAPCPPLYVNFTDSSYSIGRNIVSWYWGLGDGTYSIKKDPGKMYLLPGKYSVSLTVEDNKGCRTTTTYPDFITIEGPKVEKMIAPLSGCVPLEVTFNARSEQEVAYKWDLGDGNVVSEPSSKHTYDLPGTYIPILTVRDSFGCTYTLPREDTIKVNSFPFATFDLKRNCAGDTTDLLFSGFGNGNKLRGIYWDFGDGHRDTGMFVKHVFSKGGDYSIGMEVVTDKGCRDSFARTARIYGADPGYSLSRPGMCMGDSLMVHHNSTADTAISHWEWTVGDSFYAIQPDPFRISIDEPGVFPIQLRLFTVNGCSYVLSDSSAIAVSDSTPLDDAIIKRISVRTDFEIDLKLQTKADPYVERQVVWLKDPGNGWKKSRFMSPTDSFLILGGLQTLSNSYCMQVQRENYCRITSPPDTLKAHCTVELKAKGDTLRNVLTWSPYIGWERVKAYEVYRKNEDAYMRIDSIPGTELSYTDTSTGCPDLSRYRIHAIEDGGFNELSQSDTAAAKPKFGYDVPAPEIWRASVEGDKYILLEWLFPQKGAMPLEHIEIYRDASASAFWESDALSLKRIDDMRVQVDDRSYVYHARVRDACGNWSPLSNAGKSVLLKVGYDRELLKPTLKWSSYKQWQEGVDHYRIERLQEDGSFLQIGRTTDDQDTFFTDDVAIELCDPDYCYRVTAVRNQPMSYPDSTHDVISHSNVDCAAVESHLYVPNAFTLNRDQLNETFQPRGLFLKSYRLSVYNRWGEKLFETTDCFGAWDGTYMGEECQVDAYAYVVEAIGADNQVYFLKGTVHLMK